MSSNKDPTVVYLLIVDDEYELPLFVADKLSEIAHKLGLRMKTAQHHLVTGEAIYGYKIIEVDISDDLGDERD